MKEIVVNSDCGGFGLSKKAFLRLRELGQKEALEEEEDYVWRGLSGIEWHKESWGREIPRDDYLLIQVVRELKEGANGPNAHLDIVSIPDGVEFEIEDDTWGHEWVSEKHGKWANKWP